MLPDMTRMAGVQEGTQAVFEFLGRAYGIANAAEQLLWVSAALRTSTGAPGIQLVATELDFDHLSDMTPRDPMLIHTDNTGSEEHHAETVEVNVRIVTTHYDHPINTQDRCWHQILRGNPIVDGYPIYKRPFPQSCLEIPLGLMSSFIGADRITPFGDDLIIKGYSKLFFATGYQNRCIIWHFIANEDDSRISFSDNRIPATPGFTAPTCSPPWQCKDALQARHFVGWTSHVRNNAGE